VGAAAAADPIALVEDVSGTSAGVEFMDYLATGREIRLGAQDRLVIDYLRSCWRETISGGTVTIGTEQSAVKGGRVSRDKIECDGGKMRLTADKAAKSGVVVFRAPPKPASGHNVAVERTIYALSPIFELGGAGRLVIERLDKPDSPLAFDIAPAQLLRGSFYDFARDGHALAAGGAYRANIAGRSVVFQVDGRAMPGATRPAGRLLKPWARRRGSDRHALARLVGDRDDRRPRQRVHGICRE
jgi:hypothetical protein